MYLSYLKIKDHPILGDISIDLINPKTKEPYSIIAFVGENGCGKTTLLNEIFDYNQSKHFIEKESNDLGVLFLRQNSLYRGAMKEIGKLISGEGLYPVNNHQETIATLRTKSPTFNPKEGLNIISKLANREINEIFEKNHIDEVYCSQQVSKKIDGKEHGYDVDHYSSGQQEILLKLKDLRNLYSSTDCVLLDEPETSLHPRWQREIINIISDMVTGVDGSRPQLFLATHSEKILESLLKKEDVLIVRLFNNNGLIQKQQINQMDLRLPLPTFAELDYVVFHIRSMEYHDELVARIMDINGHSSILDFDKYIRNHDLYERKIHRKDWINIDKNGKETTYKSLPTYIRNYFHHPKQDMAPTEEELKTSILLLRDILKE